MRAYLRAASAVLLPLVAAAALFANPAVWPQGDRAAPPKTATLPLTVHADPLAGTTRLSLPRAIVGRLRAEAPPTGEDGTGRASLPVTNTVIAGVALSAAVVVGGLWLARAGRRRVLVGFACLLAALVVVGVSCLPRQKDPDRPPDVAPPVLTLQADGTLAGRCRMERCEGDEVVLSINQAALTDLARQSPVKEDGR
jgi:hypothetical protein